jgi:thioredoxin-related protein
MTIYRILFVFLFGIISNYVSAQVEWLTFEEAVAKAKTDPKPIFIDVYTDWCGWCKKMDAATFSEAKVAEMLQNDFYPVKFNAEQQESINFNNHEFKFIANGRKGYNELAVALLDGKLSYPSVVFLNEKMERITILAGYRGPDDFYPILQFIGSGQYQSKTFEEYKKSL